MRPLRFLILCAGALSVASPAQAACSLGKLMFNLGEKTTQFLHVGRGEYCAGDLVLPGLTVFRIEVEKQPKNGLVSVNQKSYVWKYRPFKTFSGEDEMVLRIYGYNNRTNGDGTMIFKIRVQ